MRAASLWTIAACLAAAALGARPDLSWCCKTPKDILSRTFPSDGTNCGEMTYHFKPEFEKADLYRADCGLECIYTAAGFLDEEKTLDEQKVRQAMIEIAEQESADVKHVVRIGLDKCFRLLRRNEDILGTKARNGCQIVPTLVWRCLGSHLLYNCPASGWTEDEPKCAGKREKFQKQELTSADAGEISDC